MRYSKLVEVYEELSSTTKRLEKIKILSKFLSYLHEDDKEVLYLLMGEIYPEYNEKKIGISNQLVIKAISKATGVNDKEVVKEWKIIGDLGLVAEKLIQKKKQSTLQSHINHESNSKESLIKRNFGSLYLTTEKILANLRKLPELEGKGTVDKKISLITELLTSATPKEALYLSRTLIGDLRIGIQNSTIRESMSAAFFNSEKEASQKISSALDKTNDLVAVFEIAKKGKLKDFEKLSVQVGKPIKAMLAQKVKTIEEGFKALGKPCACFPKGEIIFSNSKIANVESLEKDNLVISKDGKLQKIIKTFRRNYKGNIIKIYPHYLFPFSLTPEHRVLIIKKELCSWKNRKLVCRPNCQEQKYGCKKNYKNYKTEWINSQNLEKGDFILFPKFKESQKIEKIDLEEFNRNKEIEEKENKIRSCSKLKGTFKGKFINRFINLSNEFFELCGWYLAEGDSQKKGEIRFSLGYKEEKEAKRIKELIKKAFDIEATIIPNSKKGIITIRAHSTLIPNFFIENFSIKSTNKKIPSFIMLAKPEKIKHFIKSYIKGDGYKSKKDIYTIVTASKNIAYQMILLLSKIGVLPSVAKYKNKGLGDIIYRIAIFGKQIDNLEKDSHKTKTNHQRFFEDDNFFYIPVKKIEQTKYEGDVFNFETEDNTYLSSAIVHNCEYKYDGFRLLIHKKGKEINLFTRTLENVTKQFPEVVEYIQKYVKGNSFIIDSEAVGYDKKTKKYQPFQSISQRIKRKHDIGRLREEFPVEINVFDIIYYNNKSLIDEPFKKRTQILRKIIQNHPYKIITAKQIITSDEKEAEEFYKKALRDNQEGVMMKSLGAGYKPGRRVGHMLKIKPEERDLDLVIVGAEYGKGKRSGWYSSFILACRDEHGKFLEIGKMGTGIKEKSAEEVGGVSFDELTKKLKPLITEEHGKEIKVKPKIVVSVTYQEIQKSPTYNSGFALRFPRFTALRPDKKAEDVSTLKEIEKDFENQRRN